MTTKVRAIAQKNNLMGMLRYELYKNANKLAKDAIEKGYYIEAISVIESMIADRLESRLSYLTKKNVGFEVLGKLINLAIKYETNSNYKNLIQTELKAWTGKRNDAIHQIVKIEVNNELCWNHKVENLKQTAEEGFEIWKKVSKFDKETRRKTKTVEIIIK